MPETRKELIKYRIESARKSDFFVVSKSDAMIQYENAAEFIEIMEKYLAEKQEK